MLGMAVRSVQLMVDRGELLAWKTPGGHRRISRKSLDRMLHGRPQSVTSAPVQASRSKARVPRVLLIEDSIHYQNLVSLLIRQQWPEVELHVAGDGIAGLAMAGQLQPTLLIVDILLPGIDGASLITSLRLHPQFRQSRLIVITSLDESQREPYRLALAGVPLVHKTRLVTDLPALIEHALATAAN